MNDLQRKQLDQESDSFFEAYYFVLRNYSLAEIRKASMRCCNDLMFYPTPKEIADRLEKRKEDENTRYLIERFTCQTCKEKVSAISDGQCLDCAQINPHMALQKRSVAPIKIDNFRMDGRMMCQECKKGPTLCIQEPSKSGPWLCVDCYRGYDDVEYMSRWKELRREYK